MFGSVKAHGGEVIVRIRKTHDGGAVAIVTIFVAMIKFQIMPDLVNLGRDIRTPFVIKERPILPNKGIGSPSCAYAGITGPRRETKCD
jgi:hypothetical protein